MLLCLGVTFAKAPDYYIEEIYQKISCDKVFMFGKIAAVYCSPHPVSFVTLKQVTLDFAENPTPDH